MCTGVRMAGLRWRNREGVLACISRNRAEVSRSACLRGTRLRTLRNASEQPHQSARGVGAATPTFLTMSAAVPVIGGLAYLLGGAAAVLADWRLEKADSLRRGEPFAGTAQLRHLSAAAADERLPPFWFFAAGSVVYAVCLPLTAWWQWQFVEANNFGWTEGGLLFTFAVIGGVGAFWAAVVPTKTHGGPPGGRPVANKLHLVASQVLWIGVAPYMGLSIALAGFIEYSTVFTLRCLCLAIMMPGAALCSKYIKISMTAYKEIETFKAYQDFGALHTSDVTMTRADADPEEGTAAAPAPSPPPSPPTATSGVTMTREDMIKYRRIMMLMGIGEYCFGAAFSLSLITGAGTI